MGHRAEERTPTAWISCARCVCVCVWYSIRNVIVCQLICLFTSSTNSCSGLGDMTVKLCDLRNVFTGRDLAISFSSTGAIPYCLCSIFSRDVMILHFYADLSNPVEYCETNGRAMHALKTNKAETLTYKYSISVKNKPAKQVQCQHCRAELHGMSFFNASPLKLSTPDG